MPKSKAPVRKVVSAKLDDQTIKEFKKMAAMRREGHSTLAARVIHAYVKGLVECDSCGHAHPIYHVHIDTGRSK